MNLIKLALNRPVTVFMAVMVIIVIGVVSFTRLPLDLFPDMDLPMAVVWTDYDGAGPEEIESVITRPIEEAVGSLGNVNSISSSSSAGNSLVMVNFQWGTNMDFAALEMRESIDMVRGFLPDEAGNPLIFRFDPALIPILQLGMSGDLEKAALTRLAEDVVKSRLERIDGVAVATIEGGAVSEVEVKVDLHRLGLYGITLEQFQQALMAENLNFVGGDFSAGGRHYQVRTLGQFQSLQDIGRVVVGQASSGPVYVEDLAEVNMVYRDERIIARMNGETVISLNIQKQSDANTVQVAAAVLREMEKMEAELPGQIRFHVALDQSDYILESINTVLQVLLLGGILAVLVLFLFLGSFSSTIIISTSIPVSLIAAFSLMYFRGMSLNIITLGGLALGIGMMVDNSIVILENIHRYRRLGEQRYQASLFGSSEVAGAIIAATLTTVVVFFPAVFVEGIASIIFAPLAWTVVLALLASLLVALTLIPMLASRILRMEKGNKKGFFRWPLVFFQALLERTSSSYSRLLSWSLRFRWLVVVLVMGLLLASLLLVPLIGFEFLPQEDSGMIMISIDLPLGSSLDETDTVTRKVEEMIQEGYADVQSVFAIVGSGGGGGFMGTTSPEGAQFFINLTGRNERVLSTQQIAESIRRDLATIPGIDFNVVDQDVMFGGGMGADDNPVSIAVKGDDLDVLQELTEEISQIVAGVQGTREVTTSFTQGRPEVQIRLDRDKASAMGVGTRQVASLVRMALDGQAVTRYRVDGREFDVRIKGGEHLLVDNLAAINKLPLLTPGGSIIPLEQVATVTTGVGPRSINRDDQVRSAFVQARLMDRDIGSVMSEIQEELATLELPLGYTIDYGGEMADIIESFTSLALALLLAIALVYMIMAAQFESLLFPFIIMFSLPQAFSGVLIALAITGKALSVPAFIGVIMLSGIVVNNGIVLVDYINTLRREHGLQRNEAIEKAGPVRLRPILMTTSTTVLGMLPLSLGLGEGSEAQAPMAIVVIGGLLCSTLITLVFVPVVYTILDDLGKYLTSLGQRPGRKGVTTAMEITGKEGNGA